MRRRLNRDSTRSPKPRRHRHRWCARDDYAVCPCGARRALEAAETAAIMALLAMIRDDAQ